MTDGFSPNPDAPVLVIGGAGVDIVGRLKSDLRHGTSNPAQIRSSFGGVARNVAENLARLGQVVTLISAVGDDEKGERLLQGLNAAGVNTNTVTSNFIQQNAALFKEASLVFIDANLSKETLRTVMSLARRAHIPVCGDPTSVGLAARFLPYLSRFYMLTPNTAEAAVLCERTTPVVGRRQALEVAKCMVTQGVKLAIVTLAAQGLYYATSETNGYISAIKTSIVDPTGAGDALTAAVIFALLNDIPLDDAVRLGVSAASLTLRYRGAVVPDLSLEKLYDQLVI